MTAASKPRQRVGFISTSNYALHYFLDSHIQSVAEDAQVILIANTDHGVPEDRHGVEFVPIPFRRSASPTHDLIHLLRTIRVIRRCDLDVVYTISPKGGFLGLLAATFARVPLRVHFFTGQVWATRDGIWRRLLKGLDQIIGRFCTFALIDSPSQRAFLIDELVIEPDKAIVLGSGSVAGIDTARFAPNSITRTQVREELGIPKDMVIVLFLGRLTRGKGVVDLLAAFRRLAIWHDNVGLIFAGPDEGMRAELEGQAPQSRVWFTGGTSAPERYFAASDIFCLPSYREGFGMVILEAAATGLPSVGSDIYGVRDAILDGKTGILHRVGDCADIERALGLLVKDESLRKQYGAAAQKRAHDAFDQETMRSLFREFHASLAARDGG